MIPALHHEMWRDETRAWQIAAASPSVVSLYHNLRFEGTPMLWYLILWVLTNLTSNMLAMQIVHVVIAAGVVFVFALFAPFGRAIKALFAFGYFPFFEYATISRSYGLLFLLFLIGTAIASSSTPRPILLAIVLALLAQVSIWGAAFAALLMSCAALHWTIHRQRQSLWGLGIAATLTALACAIAYIQAKPGPGESFILFWSPGTSAADRLMGSVGTLWKGFIPLPAWQREFWNSNLLDHFYITQFLLACALLLLAMVSLLRQPIALLLLLIGLGGQIAFTYSKFTGQTRHHGQLFIVLIVAYWLAERWPKRTPPGRSLARVAEWFDRNRAAMLGSLLAIDVIGGIGANVADTVLPFSAGKATANYIRREFPPDVTLAGVEDYCMSPISAYLGREFYFPEERCFSPFNTQNDQARQAITHESFLDDLRMLTLTRHRDIVLVLSDANLLDPNRAEYDLEIPATAGAPRIMTHVKLMQQFANSTIPDERFTVYLFHRIE